MTRGRACSPIKDCAPAQVCYEGSRGAEISQVEAEGMRSAEGVLAYVEGVRMPTTKKVKGHRLVAFYGCGIYARENREAEIDARLGAPE